MTGEEEREVAYRGHPSVGRRVLWKKVREGEPDEGVIVAVVEDEDGIRFAVQATHERRFYEYQFRAWDLVKDTPENRAKLQEIERLKASLETYTTEELSR